MIAESADAVMIEIGPGRDVGRDTVEASVSDSAACDSATTGVGAELKRQQARVDDPADPTTLSDESAPDAEHAEHAEVLATIDLGSEVGDIVIGPNGDQLYVATVDGVAVIDAAHELVATIPMAGHPKHLLTNADRTYINVTTYEGPVVTINTLDNTITTIPGVPGTAEAASQDGTCIYIGHAATSAGGLISALTIEETTSLAIPVAGQITGLVVSLDGRDLYAAVSERVSHHQYETGWLVVIDTATLTTVVTIEVGVTPDTITVSPDGSRIFVSHPDTDSVSVVDPASRQVSTIALPDSPLNVTVSPDSGHVFVTNRDSLAVIDAATYIVQMVAVGNLPRQLDFGSAGKHTYVTNFGDQSVSVIDTLTNAVVTTVAVGGHPEAIGMSPDGTRLYVADYWARSVTVISIPTSRPTLTSTEEKYGQNTTAMAGVSHSQGPTAACE